MAATNDSQSLFAANKRVTFLLLCITTVLLLYVKKSFIENETAAFEFLQDRPEGAILNAITLVQFITIPLVYFWKFSVIGFVIWVGCFMYGYRITFSQCWGITIVAECVFLLPEFIKILYFLFIHTDPNLNEIRAYYPLSLMNFFDYATLGKQFAYPLRALNLFELVYCYVLISGVHFYARREKKAAWIIVLTTYVPIFLLWLVFYVVVYK